jgi:putative acetyltransferase
MNSGTTIRTITLDDNAAIAQIIRSTLLEYGAARPGTVYYDESTDRLSEVFGIAGSAYYIAEQDGGIVGGAGIYPTENLDADTCELVKMYLLPSARGTGLGRRLMDMCIDFVIESGYKRVYLETMPELKEAIRLYHKMGFERLTAPLGDSGHHGCGIWMAKKVDQGHGNRVIR